MKSIYFYIFHILHIPDIKLPLHIYYTTFCFLLSMAQLHFALYCNCTSESSDGEGWSLIVWVGVLKPFWSH